ncbi:MAG: PhoH family protein, partial [Bacteroidota bacterium]
MGEKTIKIEGIHPPDILGLREEKLQLLKNIFPKLKLIARGNEIKAIGEEQEVAFFEHKLQEMM